jgi:membrane protease YdiL (CAAX protease family)
VAEQAPSLRWPILGVLAAIAVTTTMDATGLSAFSALPLFPLMALFWYLQRLPRQSVGFVWGRWRHYGLALLYPVLVLGLITLISTIAGAVDVSRTHWGKAGINCLLISVSTVLIVILTEEGFFRGWLWASLERAGEDQGRILIWSSIAFALWHLSAVVLETGFNPPMAQVPTFMINAAVMGAAWGLMRWISGSVIVASVSHGVWNGFTYVLFGFGTRAGALGIKETWLYGPEVGLLGLALNAIFVIIVWRRIQSGRRATDEYA